MKRAVILLSTMTVVALGMVAYVGGASAGEDEVCPGTKVDVENLPATIDGVIITLVDADTVRFDIPERSTVQVCVKAGSAEQGEGPEFFTLTADADLDHSSGKELSHVSVISVVTTSTPPPPPPTTSTTTTTTTTTTSQPPPPSTSSAAPPPTTGTQTPGPGGAGGSPIIAATSITKHHSNNTKSPTEELAFTGPENVVPIGAIVLLLASMGSGLLWVGSKRRNR